MVTRVLAAHIPKGIASLTKAQKASKLYKKLEGKYFKNTKKNSPVAVILQPHPQYGGTMNNRIVQETYNVFIKN